jgi:hypothetical protein
MGERFQAGPAFLHGEIGFGIGQVDVPAEFHVAFGVRHGCFASVEFLKRPI